MRSLVVVTPPASAPVTLDEAKAQLRVRGYDDDDLIQALIDAASQALDGPSGWLGRALVTQTLQLQVDHFFHHGEGGFDLPCPPIASVSSIKYDDPAGSEQTVPTTAYRLVSNVVSLKPANNWPATLSQAGAVRIQYEAGYGDAEDVPAPIKQAIRLAVRNLYSLGERNLYMSRKSISGISDTQWVVSDAASKVITDAAESLLSTFRVW